MLYLALAFEPKMALSAIIAVIHDVFITVGIYALVGFEVTPATVIGFLTILGYSLYDTVVVFDKVRENTKGITATAKQTYSQASNLALNQTFSALLQYLAHCVIACCFHSLCRCRTPWCRNAQGSLSCPLHWLGNWNVLFDIRSDTIVSHAAGT
jgi:preprotein translocase subunit SecF